MPTPTVEVKVHMQTGTGQGGATPPPDPNGTLNWQRALKQDSGGNWNTVSEWWYYYSGGNGQNANQHGVAGGEIDMPAASGGCFSIGPADSEVITQVSVHDSASANHYTPNPPTPDGNGVYVITDAAHSDPTGTTDSFDVYAKFNANAIVVKCDPIIRNK